MFSVNYYYNYLISFLVLKIIYKETKINYFEDIVLALFFIFKIIIIMLLYI